MQKSKFILTALICSIGFLSQASKPVGLVYSINSDGHQSTLNIKNYQPLVNYNVYEKSSWNSEWNFVGTFYYYGDGIGITGIPVGITWASFEVQPNGNINFNYTSFNNSEFFKIQ